MELQRIKFLVSARVKKVERFGLRNYLKPNKNKSGGKKFNIFVVRRILDRCLATYF
jgi:hypothetical protein